MSNWEDTYANDFNGDGNSDILFSQGQFLGVWTENSSLNPTWTLLSNNTNGWSVVGSGDYNGDGTNDILWQNGQSLGVWTENGLNPTWHLLSNNLNGWSVVGGGDYTGFGSGAVQNDDILFQNGQNLGVWVENGNLNPTWHLLSNNLNGWSVVGSGDYNGAVGNTLANVDDILFEQGQFLGVWTFDTSGNLNPTWHLLSNNLNGWSVVGSADLNGDNRSDILFQNGSELGVWTEDSNLNPTWHLLSTNLNGWRVVGTSDYNGATNDGIPMDDILFQNGQNLGVWTFDSHLNSTWHLLSNNLNGWSIASAGNGTIR